MTRWSGTSIHDSLELPAATARFVPGGADGFDAVVRERAAALDGAGLRAAGLTRREAQVLELVALGFTNAQIALELGLRERTVAKHLEHIYGKSGVVNRTAAVAWAPAGSTADYPAQPRIPVGRCSTPPG